MSSTAAALIAHLAFWSLFAYGWWWQEIGVRAGIVFLTLWGAGFFGLSYLTYGAALFPSYVAVLDIALVFLIFKGDVRLT